MSLLDNLSLGLNLNPFSLVDSILNRKSNKEANKTNKQIAEDNLAFQNENFEYQKKLQQQIFDREDTSYQRTVEDMRNAGLSPLTMGGTNGAGTTIATTAPQNGYVESPNIDSSLSSMLSTQIANDKRFKLEKEQSDAQVEKTKAETDLITLQKNELARNEEYNIKNGLYSNEPKVVRALKIILKYADSIPGMNKDAISELKKILNQEDVSNEIEFKAERLSKENDIFEKYTEERAERAKINKEKRYQDNKPISKEEEKEFKQRREFEKKVDYYKSLYGNK